MNLTLERAKEINKTHVTEESLVIHSLNVCYAMGAMAKHFGEDIDHWEGVGYLHDFDYQEFPEEHLQHTEKELLAEGVSEEDVRAILAHGFEIVNDVEPKTNMEKSLFTVDELTGIIQACARMRPNGILDLEVKSCRQVQSRLHSQGLCATRHGREGSRRNLHRGHARTRRRNRAGGKCGIKNNYRKKNYSYNPP